MNRSEPKVICPVDLRLVLIESVAIRFKDS